MDREKQRKTIIEKIRKIIDDKIKALPITQRKQAYLELEKMAITDFEGDQRKVFLEALYTAQSTQAIQMEIGVERALERIRGK